MRYLPLSDADRAQMMEVIGIETINDLFSDVPEGLLDPQIELPDHQSELMVERTFESLSARNQAAGDGPFFIGAGAYRHHIPASVDHIIQRSEFLTSYTPYQPEIAQGTLQYLFEFQTQVATLTGMEVANASMYDGSTACAEAALMARRITRRRKLLISGGLHPHYEAVTRLGNELLGDEVIHIPLSPADPAAIDYIVSQIDTETSCVIVQTPDIFGMLYDLTPLAAATQKNGALLIVVVTETVSLGAIHSPGDQGADIVVCEGQSIGNALNFGGPYVGLFATRQKYMRQMPGRLCGQTRDRAGDRGYVLTLSTREQHIRREKATSNICTNSGLCALAFSVHMSLLGGAGLRQMAHASHGMACKTADALSEIPGVALVTPQFFNEFTLRVPGNAGDIIERLAQSGVLGGVPGTRLWPDDRDKEDLIILAASEVTTEAEINTYREALEDILQRGKSHNDARNDNGNTRKSRDDV